MNYTHYLYPLPPLERLSTPSRSLDIPKELRCTLSEQFFKPQIDWTKYRLWRKEPDYRQDTDGSYVLVSGLFLETKYEVALAQEANRKLHQEQVNRELAAAKKLCESMTIQEAWRTLQGHLHTNEYDVEGMSDADWYTYQHAKDLLDNHINQINS